MNIKIEKLKNSQKLIKVEIDKNKVKDALDDVYSGIQKKAKVSGYRPGKAPRDVVEAHYEGSANEEALNRLIWDSYREAVVKESIDPVGYPVVEGVDFNKGSSLKFSVKVDVRPEFSLKKYKAIKVKRKSADITDKDIDDAIKNIQESMAQYKNVDPRPIEKGDYIVSVYECYPDVKLVDKNDKLWLYINDQLEPKELLNVLIGSEIDILKEVEVTYPKDYHYKELAGTKRLYKVTPKQIQQKIVPEINDDLAKETGRFKSLDELKKFLSENIAKSRKQEAEKDIENQIFQSLTEAHSFEVPDSIVQRQATRLIEETKQRLLYQGYKKEDLDKDDDKLKESVKESAINNVCLFFIIEKIAKEENIKVSDQDIDKRIQEIAKHGNESVDKTRKKLEEKDLLGSLNEQILHDKVVEYLVKESKEA